jgi:hypothetical protein
MVMGLAHEVSVGTIFRMRDFTWSKTQKEAARHAFDLASQRDTQAIRSEVEGMLRNSKEPRVVWQIEDYLFERRREHDRVFDYRYSVLIYVFAGLVRESLLSEEELEGIGEEKVEAIKGLVSIR